jgi:hypothetical protein
MAGRLAKVLTVVHARRLSIEIRLQESFFGSLDHDGRLVVNIHSAR